MREAEAAATFLTLFSTGFGDETAQSRGRLAHQAKLPRVIPDTAKGFNRSTAGKLSKQHVAGDDGGMAKGRYWDGPEEAHRSYCDAVSELSDKFMRERRIVPETMTPDEARDLLKQIRESDDSRIRDFNRSMRMLRRSFEAASANEAAGHGDRHDERAHQRISQSLHEKAAEVLDVFGRKGFTTPADYWIVDDDWGLDFIRVEVQNLQMFRPVVVEKLKGILIDFPGWHIAVRVAEHGEQQSWPLMGILIFPDRVIDHLKREYLPPEFRQWIYDGL